MQLPGESVRGVQGQEMAADGAGLEPSATGAGEAVVPPAEPHAPGAGHGRGPQTGGGRNGAGKMSRAHLPVTIATVMALALPTLAEQMLSAVIGFTDTIVAGHTGGDDTARAASAAAVGTMTYLQWFAGLMTSALGVGASAIVYQMRAPCPRRRIVAGVMPSMASAFSYTRLLDP